jgi:hypothetical protein
MKTRPSGIRKAEVEIASLVWLLDQLQTPFAKESFEGWISDRFAKMSWQGSRQEWTDLMSEVLGGLMALADGKPWHVKLGSVRLQFFREDNQILSLMDAQGGFRANCLHGIFELVKAHGHRITRCDAEECRKLFVKRKRGLFCEAKCSLRERQRTFRERHRVGNGHAENQVET